MDEGLIVFIVIMTIIISITTYEILELFVK